MQHVQENFTISTLLQDLNLLDISFDFSSTHFNGIKICFFAFLPLILL